MTSLPISLAAYQLAWKDTPESHQAFKDEFDSAVNADPLLKDYRDYIEAGAWGFGERAFVWMWKLILQAMPPQAKMLEIGVHRGAILLLWQLAGPRNDYEVYGISPMNGEGLPGLEGQDFMKDVDTLHEIFGQLHPTIIKGYSTDPDVIKKAAAIGPLDCLYVDGSHSFDDVQSDIKNYAPLVRPGGYMILDDCCNYMKMPFGFFQGIMSVSQAVDCLLPPLTPSDEWEFLFSVIHNRVFRRR